MCIRDSINTAGSSNQHHVVCSGWDHGEYGGSDGGTACETTDWSADSIIRCNTPQGYQGTRRWTVSVGEQWGTATALFSFDIASVSSFDDDNSPATASTSITLAGQHFGNRDYTSKVRVGAGCVVYGHINTAGLSLIHI